MGTNGTNACVPSGRRACLFLGTFATLVGLAIAVSMNSLHGLWLSMIPGALLQHNFEVYKALLSEYHNDIEHIVSQNKEESGEDKSKGDSNRTPASSRSGSVGKLGMAVGISFTTPSWSYERTAQTRYKCKWHDT